MCESSDVNGTWTLVLREGNQVMFQTESGLFLQPSGPSGVTSELVVRKEEFGWDLWARPNARPATSCHYRYCVPHEVASDPTDWELTCSAIVEESQGSKPNG